MPGEVCGIPGRLVYRRHALDRARRRRNEPHAWQRSSLLHFQFRCAHRKESELRSIASGLAKFEYLNALQLVEINKRVLQETRARKADSHRVASRTKLEAIIAEVRALDGDAFAKAACLLTGLTKRHAFDSGNRRTAYAAAKLFLEANGKTTEVEHDPRVLTGIREGFYSTEEVVEWLKGNGIREFRRHN